MNDLFLCHSGADKEWVRKLAAEVEAEQWNGRPLAVFLDEWDIDLGSNIVVKINEALAGSRFVGVVMSPELVDSAWCQAEVSAVLSQDPTNRLGRLVPLRLRDVHKTSGERLQVPPLLSALNYLDFRDDRRYRRSLARLLAKLRGESPRPGVARSMRHDETPAPIVSALPSGREDPDHVPETLIGNLLPVRVLPATIWSAPTQLMSKHDLSAGTTFPPCLIREGRLYCFNDLARAKNPFEELTQSANVSRVGMVDWIGLPDRWRWYIEMLNDTLRRHMRGLGIGFDREHDRYYFMTQGPSSGTRYLRWGAGDRRWVVRAPDPGRQGYWVHQAAKLHFETLGRQVYLSVEPSWAFTTDGRTPVARDIVGPLTMKWSGKERNGAILRHILMWSDVLAGQRRDATIVAGDQQLVLGRLPATVRVPVSLADDRVRVGALLEFTRAEIFPNTGSALLRSRVEGFHGPETDDAEA